MRRLLRALIALLVAAALAGGAAPAFAQVDVGEPGLVGADVSCSSGMLDVTVLATGKMVMPPAMPDPFCNEDGDGGNSDVGHVS